MQIPSLSKFTPHNIFIKWPRIIFDRYAETYVRRSPLGGLLFTGKPVVLTDDFGMRFVLYPDAHEPLEKLLTRRYLADEYKALDALPSPLMWLLVAIAVGDLIMSVSQ